MKKVNKTSLLLGLILGILITSVTVYAITVKSSNVLFTPEDTEWEVTSVEDALNDLYKDRLNEKNIAFEGESYNYQTIWGVPTNSLSTSYKLKKGKYLLIVTGQTSIQNENSISVSTITLNQNAKLIKSSVKHNKICDNSTPYKICANAKIVVNTYYLETENELNLSASYKSSDAMEQKILLQVFKLS